MALITTHANNQTDSVPGRLRQHLTAKEFAVDKLITSPNYRYELLIPIPKESHGKPEEFVTVTLERFASVLEDFTECDFRLVDATNVGDKVSIRIAAIGKGKVYKKAKTASSDTANVAN